ncbi:metallopeptidase putative metallo-peptidase Clan MP Family M67 [Leptomonas seymouri]|uniref:Metallopeptidase putative metallo-peptidase Clan MP Family M67 n=1 Tax=Leptomonas seymouri TaxID=5684 RepID=A0A0N1PFL1_LEPSE|nr:metallopeptidase putative metallo-peptidase Clan MP Family M67 [Leptomonas seymouri]|eukprot:KPI88898.1 metallopeptidase putative metallo-peptidase Clan MP Family M67 [Leptomonas seymouri]
MQPKTLRSSGDSTTPLREVRVSEQVIHSCFRHAFTTEKEEVVGMLLGRLETRYYSISGSNTSSAAGASNGAASPREEKAAACPSLPIPPTSSAVRSPPPPGFAEGKLAYIWATHISERSVQCSDRVEVSPESLASAAETADRVTAATGVNTAILGWYHSHPKIPVVPSVVDLRTQKEHQQHFESGWVGLIVSLFNSEASFTRGHCALHCFQAGLNGEHIPIPVHVVSEAELFASATPLQALPDTTPDLLRVLQREIVNGVRMVEEKAKRNAAATRAARGLADAQLYEVHGLVAEPIRNSLQLCSLPALRAEVARLEKMLAALPASAPAATRPP